ncbi:hypothetical protein [Flavobacterium mesophilum]|uniref:hypothetical protein n=1 Tax=Flavobacterium mesophilum TaxID=3143495 RepID=UPI0031DB57BC
MELIKSLPFKIILPLVLLGVQFSLKYFIDRRATAYNFATSILEIPISILFISISLLSGYIIAELYNVQTAFLYLLGIIVIVIFCIFFWRRSIEHLENKNFGYSIMLGILNLIISLPILIFIIFFIISNTIKK